MDGFHKVSSGIETLNAASVLLLVQVFSGNCFVQAGFSRGKVGWKGSNKDVSQGTGGIPYACCL
ncbi:hypothetical protein, partial [Kistimonas scapharcae]|uniref:hypothetical protein n=1 Tax=Kistimonas scapharcae TaxID=1036133 RepID=UPI0031F1575D